MRLVFSAPSELATNTYKVIFQTVRLYTNLSTVFPRKAWRNCHNQKVESYLELHTDLESACSAWWRLTSYAALSGAGTQNRGPQNLVWVLTHVALSIPSSNFSSICLSWSRMSDNPTIKTCLIKTSVRWSRKQPGRRKAAAWESFLSLPPFINDYGRFYSPQQKC